MTTILDDWIKEEREPLEKAYTVLEEILSYEHDLKINEIRQACEAFGLTLTNAMQAEDNKTLTIQLASQNLQVSLDPETRLFHLKQVRKWKSLLDKKSNFKRYRDIDAHAIHMHMLRLHGSENLVKMKSEEKGACTIVPYAIDKIQTDDLSLHLIESQMDGTKKTLKEIIEEGARNDAPWPNLNGAQRRGVFLTKDITSSDKSFKIEGEKVTISTKNQPESFVHSPFIERPIHLVIDIGGYKNNKLKITQVRRNENQETIEFTINRFSSRLLKTIEIDHRIYMD